MEETDVLLRAVIAHRVVAVVKRLPAHLIHTLQHQLNIDVLAMALQFGMFAAAPGDVLNDGKQIIAHDGMPSWCE